MWLVAVVGCYLQSNGVDGPKGKGKPVTSAAAYNALVSELEAERDWFGGEEIGEMWAAGERVYWLEYRDWDPTLHSLDTLTDQQVNHDVVLSFEQLTLSVGEEAYASIVFGSNQLEYQLFSASSDNLLETTKVATPPGGVNWWPYAVDGTELYIAIDEGSETALFRASASGEPERLFTFESVGIDGSELWDFGVDGDLLVAVEGGRIWTLDLGTREARWLENEMQVGGQVSFNEDGVLFTSYDGSMDVPWYWSASDDELVNLAEEIAAIEPHIDGLYETSHRYEQDITRWNDRFVYGGSAGIFIYDPSAPDDRAIAPVLLDSWTDVRVDYRYPVVTDGGELFVTALVSESGAVGADGPIYRVTLSP